MDDTDPSNSFHSTMIDMDEPMNSHRELFNKLVASQSQPTMNMIISQKADCHQSTLDYDTSRCSSAIDYQPAKRPTNQLVGQHQQVRPRQRRCSSLSGPSSTSSTTNGNTIDKQQQHSHLLGCRSVSDLLPDDFKREPVAFSSVRNRWYTNEEVASILTNFSSHAQWQTDELQLRPKSGAVYLYSRDKVRYRQDGYCWKKRKNGRTTREDHMKLKVQGIECIYGCYVHSAILPTFHRRCYWLLQNPDVVLVHYLNQPIEEHGKVLITFNSSTLQAFTRRSWTNEEIIEEIGSVFGGISQIKHMLNINMSSDTSTLLQQPVIKPELQLARQETMLIQQQLLVGQQQQQQQQPTVQNSMSSVVGGQYLLGMPNDTDTYTDQICCADSEVVVESNVAHDSNKAHAATPTSPTNLLALDGNSFGPQFNDESSNLQLNPSFSHHQIQIQEPVLDQRQEHLVVDEGRATTSLADADVDDEMLMNDFNLQAASSLGQVDDELVSNVIESLSNVDDLRDLLSVVTSNNDNVERQSQTIAGSDSSVQLSQPDNDSNHDGRMSSIATTSTTGVSSFDLYNNYSHKTDQANQEYYEDHNGNQLMQQEQQYYRQQLGTRSSMSDETELLLMRPSPSAPVFRSNSTGNTVNSPSCNMSNTSWSSYDSGTS